MRQVTPQTRQKKTYGHTLIISILLAHRMMVQLFARPVATACGIMGVGDHSQFAFRKLLFRHFSYFLLGAGSYRKGEYI